jgi:hypothetical protein
MAVLSHHDRLGLRWSDARIALVNGAAFLRACASVMGPPPPRWRITHAKRASAATRTTTTNPATSSSTASIGHIFPDLSSDPASCDRCCLGTRFRPRGTRSRRPVTWNDRVVKHAREAAALGAHERASSDRMPSERDSDLGGRQTRHHSLRRGRMSRPVMRQSAIGSAIGLATPGRALHPPAPILS